MNSVQKEKKAVFSKCVEAQTNSNQIHSFIAQELLIMKKNKKFSNRKEGSFRERGHDIYCFHDNYSGAPLIQISR